MKMKKYLIMVLAIAISGIFVGCHEEEFSGSLIEQKKATFEETFIKAFGQPDPNHHWGFKTRNLGEALTRADLNMNGNMWETCPTLGENEEQDVLDYVNMTRSQMRAASPEHKFTEVFPVNIENYFVTQVHCGTDTYTNLDNQSGILGSSHMNHLMIKESSTATLDDIMGKGDKDDYTNTGWFHVNNFNRGDDTDWQGNTLVGNAGTYDFAYHGTEDSRYHNKWIAVKGEDIDAKYAGYYYICFDFEQQNEKAYTNYRAQFWNPEGNNGGEWVEKNFSVPGAWTVETLQERAFTVQVEMWSVKEQKNKTFTYVLNNDGVNTKNLRIDNVVNGNMCVPANDVYTDWIIRLVEAQPINNPSAPDVMTITGEPGKRYTKTGLEIVESGRVMCEDLAGATGNFDDMDYNDVVYDAIIFREYKYLCTETGALLEDNDFTEGYDRTYANVRLMAAGGTIPVEIVIGKNNYNVHNELGGSNNVMINTLPNTPEERASVNGAEVLETEPKTLVDDEGSEKLYGVELISDIKLNVLYQNVSTELTTKYGGATYMFCVPLGLPWAKERKSFAEVYPYFPDWVKQEQNTTWYNTKNPGQFYKDLVGLTEPEIPEPTIEFYDNNGVGSTLQRGTVPANPGTMAYPTSSETVLFNFAAEGSGPGYLCPAVTTQDGQTYEEQSVTLPGISDITVGKIIRIYGVYINNWYISPNFSSTINSDADNGYIDIAVDESNLSKIQNGITIKGQNFTVTYVTVY